MEIKTSMIFGLDLASNTILSCVFFIFLVIDLYFLISEVMAQIFNPITELVIPLGIPSKEEKAELEIRPIISKAKIVNLFVLLTYQFIWLYFFKQVIS